MNLKQLFCKHSFKRVGTTRCGGILRKGKVSGCQCLYYNCKCSKCGKRIDVYDTGGTGK